MQLQLPDGVVESIGGLLRGKVVARLEVSGVRITLTSSRTTSKKKKNAGGHARVSSPTPPRLPTALLKLLPGVSVQVTDVHVEHRDLGLFLDLPKVAFSSIVAAVPQAERAQTTTSTLSLDPFSVSLVPQEGAQAEEVAHKLVHSYGIDLSVSLSASRWAVSYQAPHLLGTS